MALHPLSNFLTTLSDTVSKALRIKGEVAITGSLANGVTDALPVQLSGSILAEQLTNDDAVANVLTFSENISIIEIFHEELTWQEFTVNGVTLTVPGGGYRTPIGGTPVATVTIPSISCIVGRLI